MNEEKIIDQQGLLKTEEFEKEFDKKDFNESLDTSTSKSKQEHKTENIEFTDGSQSNEEEEDTLKETSDELNDEERMQLYEKGLSFLQLKNENHALLCFLGCLRGLKPTSKSKFTMLPQCLTHISEIYAHAEDYQRAVEFMQAAKLYYEIAIIETGIQVDNYKKESSPEFQPLDLDPLLDDAKRANEYERLSNTCLKQKKFQLALEYCGKATKLRQKVYGDDNALTVKSLDLFTLIYAEMGKNQYSEALNKYGDVIKKINAEAKQKAEKIESPEVEEVATSTDNGEVNSQSIQTDEEFLVDSNEKIIPKDEISLKESSTNQLENSPKPKKKVHFSPDTNFPDENESPIKFITPLQFFMIFLISAFLAILFTSLWCYISGSPICPSYQYFYVKAKYWLPILPL